MKTIALCLLCAACGAPFETALSSGADAAPALTIPRTSPPAEGTGGSRGFLVDGGAGRPVEASPSPPPSADARPVPSGLAGSSGVDSGAPHAPDGGEDHHHPDGAAGSPNLPPGSGGSPPSGTGGTAALDAGRGEYCIGFGYCKAPLHCLQFFGCIR